MRQGQKPDLPTREDQRKKLRKDQRKGQRKKQRIKQEKDSGRDSGRFRVFQQLVWIVLILAQMAVVNQLEVRAEKRAEQVFRQVEQEIRYDNVENAAAIPQQVTVTVREGEQEVQAVCDLQEAVEENAGWQEGFELPITFHVYDADSYTFEGRTVPRNDGKPQLEGHEEDLLRAAGLSLEHYRIRDVIWDGESYTDEHGELCRDAVAVGDKLVCSYRAYYTGTAVFPAQKAPVFEPAQEAEEGAMEPSQPETGTDMEGQEEQSRPEPVHVLPEEENGSTDGEQEAPGLWERITRTLLIAVGIGALLFFLGLFLLAGLHMAKMVHLWYINRRKENKEDQEHVYRK